ncbi:MAG: hypothetical protein KatS3mg129_3075 [Leptospiraceae bacterium]|nr:MAG: hypothetical protein KatS3mg129_3075 [Leptospiraceae bacterium]
MWRIFLDSSVLVNYKKYEKYKEKLEYLIERKKKDINFISSKLLELEVLPLERHKETKKFYQIFFKEIAKTQTHIDDGTVRKALELRENYILQPMDSLHIAGLLNKQIKESSYKKPNYLFLTLDDGILTEGEVLEKRVLKDRKNKVIAVDFDYFMDLYVENDLKNLLN